MLFAIKPQIVFRKLCKGGMQYEKFWEDLDLMRRLFRYDPDSGLIYACDRLEKDFYDTGTGSSFVSAAGAASKYNI